MATGLRLAAITPADHARFLALVRALHTEDGHPLDAGGERAVAEVCAGHPLARGFLVHEGEAVIGYAALTLGFGIQYGGADAFLDDLYLIPAVRGRGLGGQIMAMLDGEARRLGAHAVHLVVDPDNHRAQRLYARHGFVATGWRTMTKQLHTD